MQTEDLDLPHPAIAVTGRLMFTLIFFLSGRPRMPPTARDSAVG